MSKRSNLIARRNRSLDRMRALRDPIPDETEHERDERQDAYYQADREYHDAKRAIDLLDYEEKRRKGDIAPRRFFKDREEQEAFDRSQKTREKEGLDDDRDTRDERPTPDDNRRRR